MDDRKILEEAKKTIDNIKQTQGALDQYLERLELIVRKLEAELYKDEKLTISDVTSINEQLSPKMIEDYKDVEEVEEKVKKKKNRFNILLFFSILSFMVTFFIQFVRLNEVVTFGNSTYLIYNQVNMEPSIKLNSLVILDNERKVSEEDIIAYYTKHKSVRIKQVDQVEEDKYVIKNVEQTIKSYEDVNKSSKIGVVKETHPKIGNLIASLSDYILVLYLISFLSFIVGLLIN